MSIFQNDKFDGRNVFNGGWMLNVSVFYFVVLNLWFVCEEGVKSLASQK